MKKITCFKDLKPFSFFTKFSVRHLPDVEVLATGYHVPLEN